VHNEAKHVESVARGLLAQDYPQLRIRNVDDQSTDGTGEILDRLAAENPRLEVIHGAQRPAGWLGKTWALAQGTQGVDAKWIWFLDGDITTHPQALSAALARANELGCDLVTLMPRPICETFWQGTISIVLGTLMFHLLPVTEVNDPRRRAGMMVGGFVLLKRAWYERVGGHASVRSEVVEDVALGQRLKNAGARMHLAAATELLTTHLYGSLREIWDGLRKNAFAITEYRLSRYFLRAAIALFLAWGPWLALDCGALGGILVGWTEVARATVLTGALGVILQILHSLPMTFAARISPFMALTAPISISLYILIATASVRDYLRGHVVWKGRIFERKELARGASAFHREEESAEV
jgi:glycosyltransferase involved in cell wall biosynthesis